MFFTLYNLFLFKLNAPVSQQWTFLSYCHHHSFTKISSSKMCANLGTTQCFHWFISISFQNLLIWISFRFEKSEYKTLNGLSSLITGFPLCTYFFVDVPLYPCTSFAFALLWPWVAGWPCTYWTLKCDKENKIFIEKSFAIVNLLFLRLFVQNTLISNVCQNE